MQRSATELGTPHCTSLASTSPCLETRRCGAFVLSHALPLSATLSTFELGINGCCCCLPPVLLVKLLQVAQGLLLCVAAGICSQCRRCCRRRPCSQLHCMFLAISAALLRRFGELLWTAQWLSAF